MGVGRSPLPGRKGGPAKLGGPVVVMQDGPVVVMQDGLVVVPRQRPRRASLPDAHVKIRPVEGPDGLLRPCYLVKGMVENYVPPIPANKNLVAARMKAIVLPWRAECL